MTDISNYPTWRPICEEIERILAHAKHYQYYYASTSEIPGKVILEVTFSDKKIKIVEDSVKATFEKLKENVF